MTPKEIKKRIDILNLEIEQCLTPNFFILNNTVLEKQKEIGALQEQCEHNFYDGYCIYCYKEQGENK